MKFEGVAYLHIELVCLPVSFASAVAGHVLSAHPFQRSVVAANWNLFQPAVFVRGFRAVDIRTFKTVDVSDGGLRFHYVLSFPKADD